MDTLTLGDTATHANTVQVQVQLEQHSPSMEQQQQAHLVQLTEAMANLPQDMEVSLPKEVILITLVSQEQALYNPKHEHYRNTQRRDAKWVEIAENVGWTETQCKSKWKAMRDQYCRELKRSKFNSKTTVKWKYFKELEFLRPYALSRNYRPRNPSTMTKANNNNSLTNAHSNNNNNTFSSTKLEATQFTACDFQSANSSSNQAQIKHETTTTRLLTLTDEQLNSVIQQQEGNWNYLTTSGTGSSNPADTTLDGNNLLESHHQQQQSGTDEMLCALVESVAAAAAAGQMQQQLGQGSHNTEEEDDDPIHTFLNMESFFEKDLIAMVQQEDILYNSFHRNYRNAKLKLEVWDEIARKLKKPVRRCRLKWKALRDQYIREHKRLKDRENAESLPRWKHYDALCFLQKFIKHKTSDFDAKHLIQIPKTELDPDLDDHMLGSSPLRSPVEVTVVAHELQQQQNGQMPLQTLPSLSGPHLAHQQQQQQHQSHHQLQQHTPNSHADNNSICVVGGGGSVSGYDEMDIDHYIIGNGSEEPVDVDEDDDEDRKSQQHFPDYTTVSNNDNNTSPNEVSHEPGESDDDDEEEFKEMKATATQESVMQQLSKQVATLTQNQQMQQQQQQQQLLQQEHHQQLLTLSVSEAHALTTDESLLQPQQLQAPQTQDFNSDPHQQQQQQSTAHALLNGVTNVCGTSNNTNNLLNTANTLSIDNLNLSVLTGTVSSTAVASTTTASNVTITAGSNSNNNNNNSGSSNCNASLATNGNGNGNANANTIEDDEVGAFFKAVAMKIRNAKMSPVAFTDLQIDILRVINGTLRNH